METGWTWDHILDHVDTRRLEALVEQSRRLPSSRDTLRLMSKVLFRYIGIKDPEPQRHTAKADATVLEFATLSKKED